MWLLLAAAFAAPTLRLPASEDPAAWADAAAIAGLDPAGDPAEGVVTVERDGAAWSVAATRGADTRRAPLAAPESPADREDALLLGVSLLRALAADDAGPTAAPPDAGPDEGGPWSWGAEVAAVYAAPRSFGDQGFGGAAGAELRHGRLALEVGARAVGPRRLHDADAEEWWVPVDAWVGAGARAGESVEVRLGGAAGLSARAFGHPDGVVQVDWKPVVGGSALVGVPVGGGWSIRARVGLDVDLGATRVEGVGEPFELGVAELWLRVGVAWGSK